MTSLLIRNLGVLLMIWSFAAVIFNPFLENRLWRQIAGALFFAGSLLFVVGLTLLGQFS